MKHYGDITKINGAEAPVVDIITGGSPCQDLSVAGKRAGLAGERSGLFMEQMRIVKEMRERERATGRAGWMVRPRYMVWENVPGAFSSGNPKGADFAAVIEEIIKVAEPGASVSVCVPNGGWTKSGCYYAEDGSWSIAWRVHDAQFWGVPQRRKRIALVADFGGLSAPEILFERKGLSGDSEQSGEAGEETAGAVGDGTEGASSGVVAKGNGVLPFDTTQITSPQNGNHPHYGDPCHPLAAGAHPPAVAIGNGQLNQISMAEQANTLDTMHDQQAVTAFAQNQVGEVRVSSMSGTLNTNSNATWRNSPLVYDARGNGNGKTVCTITGDHQNSVTDYTALCVGNGQDAYNDMLIAMASTAAHAEITTDGVSQSLLARAGTGGNNMPNITRGSIVRRLTPLECERLQGYPDGWTDIGEWVDSKGKKHGEADSPRYKALGNSIALPFWQWMARRICAQYERPVTMASLFDGIGGFPLVFQRCGAVPVWASEIEEFPIAVTKVRLPDESV